MNDNQYDQLLSAFNRIWLLLLLLCVMGAVNISLMVIK